MLSTEPIRPAVSAPLPKVQSRSRRIGFAFLCTAPFLNLVVLGVRAFHVDGVYQIAGVAYFSTIMFAMWSTGARALFKADAAVQRLALAGVLLLVPLSLIGLLWVGIGAPWQATLAENRMRFLVLAAGSIALTSGFVILQQALREEGEGVVSSLALAFSLLAGASYLVWFSFHVGVRQVHLQTGQVPSFVQPLSDVLDTLEFFACALTYAAAFLFSVSFGLARWIRRGASAGLALASALGFTLLNMRGISYPDLDATTAPWYVRPGFISGVPAICWIIPILLGAIVLRRAGREMIRERSALTCQK